MRMFVFYILMSTTRKLLFFPNTYIRPADIFSFVNPICWIELWEESKETRTKIQRALAKMMKREMSNAFDRW